MYLIFLIGRYLDKLGTYIYMIVSTVEKIGTVYFQKLLSSQNEKIRHFQPWNTLR